MSSCAPMFVVSTGRCATTLLGLFLAEADSSLVLNEGQMRDAKCQGPQVLKALTLENRLAYEQPDRAAAILEEKRLPHIKALIDELALDHYVEIAYYFSPFVSALRDVFPEAKIAYVHRDGRDFVRSVYVDESPDPMPVGYPDPRQLSPTERYVAMGRLAPLPGSFHAKLWDSYSPFEKNVWLWAETNRLILEGIKAWPSALVKHISMNDMLTPKGLRSMADFLQMDVPLQKADEILRRKVNFRKNRKLDHWSKWDDKHKDDFRRLGQDMLQTLGYEIDETWQVTP